MDSPAKTAPTPLYPIERRTPTGIAAVFLFILIVLSSAMVGVGLRAMYAPTPVLSTAAEIASGVLAVLILLFVWRGTPSAKGILPVLILGGGVIVFFTSSLIPAAVLLCLVFSVGAGGFLVSVLPRKALLLSLLIPAAVYGITAAATLHPVAGCLGLIPFPAMVALGLGTRHSASRENGLTRVGVLCLTSATLLVTLAGAVLLSLFLTVDGFNVLNIPEVLEAFRAAYIEEIITEYNLQLESLEIPAGTSPEVIELLTQRMTYKEAANMVSMVFNLMPAVVVILINLTSLLAQLLTQAALRTFGHEASVTDRVKAFRMSLVSCVVFTAAYFTVLGFILDLGAGSESSLGGVIALNIYAILLPGMAFAGLLRLVEWVRKKNPKGVGCLVASLVFIPFMWIVAPLILPIVEVVGNVFSAFSSLFSFVNDSSDGDDDDPFDRF